MRFGAVYPSRVDGALVVRESCCGGVCGRGLFCRTPLKAGTTVIYGGDYISAAAVRWLRNEDAQAYVAVVGHLAVDGRAIAMAYSRPGRDGDCRPRYPWANSVGLGCFANHSATSPNLVLGLAPSGDHIVLRVIADIPERTELLVDYGAPSVVRADFSAEERFQQRKGYDRAHRGLIYANALILNFVGLAGAAYGAGGGETNEGDPVTAARQLQYQRESFYCEEPLGEPLREFALKKLGDLHRKVFEEDEGAGYETSEWSASPPWLPPSPSTPVHTTWRVETDSADASTPLHPSLSGEADGARRGHVEERLVNAGSVTGAARNGGGTGAARDDLSARVSVIKPGATQLSEARPPRRSEVLKSGWQPTRAANRPTRG